MDSFDITNLTLDDNSFMTVPEGDYHFKVDSHHVEFSTSDKMPENTQVVVCHLTIPVIQDGELTTCSVKTNLNIYRKGMFAVRKYAECIGLVPEKGRQTLDLTTMDGHTGICKLLVGVSARGNEYNQVDEFYSPSKAPSVCANDEAWEKFNSKPEEGFITGEEAEVNPFT